MTDSDSLALPPHSLEPRPLEATDAGCAPATAPRRPRSRRVLTISMVLAFTFLLLMFLVLLPRGKVIEGPGPTWDVLGQVPEGGEQEPSELIAVSGAPTYPTAGSLRMTTVSVRGCPGHPITAFDVIVAWFSSDQVVVDRERVCPVSLSAEEVDQQSQQQMTSSQDAAVVSALMESGVAQSMTLTIRGGASDATKDLFQDGDVLREVTLGGTTTQVTTYAQLRALLEDTPPGTEAVLGIERDGQPTTVELSTQAPPEQGRKGSVLGVFLNARADSEANASFALSDVGGPSAGMVFALGIFDKLTPEPLVNGEDVAGTGTIDIAGNVGPIGGIPQKMRGAARDGATLFLAPAANCAEVVGNEPAGMRVVPVATLHEAVTAVTALRDGDTGSLPTCEAVLAKG